MLLYLRLLIVCYFVGTLLGCSNGSTSNAANSSIYQLESGNLNLIFVRDLERNPQTGNLSITGFNHALKLGSVLQTLNNSAKVLGVYSLSPATHLVSDFPDMVPLQTIEDFALLNQESIQVVLDYNSLKSNVTLIEHIINANSAGSVVFAMTYDMINATINALNKAHHYGLNNVSLSSESNAIIPIISITPKHQATLHYFVDDIPPNQVYPNLNIAHNAACQELSYTYRTKDNGYQPPVGINKNEVVYFVRHAEAHPGGVNESTGDYFENGNYVCQGQWRVISAPDILQQIMGKMPDFVYSIDPSQMISTPYDKALFYYVRPSLTINTYNIKYGQPLSLMTNYQWYDDTDATQYFFMNNTFSNKTLLLGWEHGQIEHFIIDLLISYGLTQAPSGFPAWSFSDYDTLWKVELDNQGNLTFSNTCEGIAESSLPTTCPSF